MPRRNYSEKVDLILKSREAALSAVQIYNNPLIEFKIESFIVLFVIAWTYLLHAYYRSKNIEYRYFKTPNIRKKFSYNQDGSFRYWDLSKCMSDERSPLDKHTMNNLKFLIGLRNQIEHKKVTELDSYFSARYQACALNFNHYLKKLHGEKYSLDTHLALSLQFAELNYSHTQTIKDKKNSIPKTVQNYIAEFDSRLTDGEIEDDRFSYKLLFSKVVAKRRGQADRVIEFIDPKSPMAKNISSEYWVVTDREKPKFRPTEVVNKIHQAGFTEFGIHQHTKFWQKHEGKNLDKGFGVLVSSQWYWYENWINFILTELRSSNCGVS